MQILEMDNEEGTLVVRLSEHEIAIMDNTFSGLVGNETAVDSDFLQLTMDFAIAHEMSKYGRLDSFTLNRTIKFHLLKGENHYEIS